MLKKILIGFVIIIGLLCVGSLFISNNYKIERDIYIKAPASVVFNQINNLKNWSKWNTWLKMDTTMKVTYNNIEAGVGAQYQWTSANKNVGNGSMQIKKSVQDQSVESELLFEGEGNAVNGFNIQPTGDSVKLTTYFESEVGWNPLHKYMMLMFKGMMIDMTDNGLKAIKELAENMPAQPGFEFNIQQVEMPSSIPYLATRCTSGLDSISYFIGSSYGLIDTEMIKQKLEMSKTVHPFAIYYKWENNVFEYDVCMPLAAAGKSAGNIVAGEVKTGKYLMTQYFGNYDNSNKAHEALVNYAKDNSIKISDAPLEFYITDPSVEKDTAKWQTDIYYQIN